MKVPIKWLKEYINIDRPLSELAELLTMAGSEVKGIEVLGDSWDGIVIAEITDVKPHPNADRLRLVTVTLGTEQPTVVCGAPNLKVGDKVAFAHIGSRLIDGHSGRQVILKSATIRGVKSSGMVCSEKELGISDSHESILVLSPESPLGTPLADFMGESVLDLDITPNRPDLLSVIGIAREVAALTGQKIAVPEASYEEKGDPIEGQVSVAIKDPDLCSRYSASLIRGLKIGESPKWLKSKLLASGMRPINNIVDITNYVMLEYGQPLHAFDHDEIKGHQIIVRPASDGETITTLDGVRRALDSGTLVIADKERVVAIAGVMGGANSEVSRKTTTVLLESANFNAASIHYTSHNLRLVSEASMRFERGISPGLTIPAVKRATELILKLAGGVAAKGLADDYPAKQPRQSILLSADKVRAVLGADISNELVGRVLTSLGFDWTPETTDEFEDFGLEDSSEEMMVYVPYWRTDISLDVDLIEEVARIIGYDKIPATLLSHPLPQQSPEPMVSLKQKARQVLTGYGFQEVVSYSLTSLEMLSRLKPGGGPLKPPPLRVANPMSIDQEYLRTTLRAGLLSALTDNRRHEDGSIRLFELGRVYRRRSHNLPYEPEGLCGILSSSTLAREWLAQDKPFDFFDAKGVVEGLLLSLDITADFEASSDAGLRPGIQARAMVGDIPVGIIGELHPRVAQNFEISGPVYLFELNLAALLPHTLGHEMYKPIARYPAVVRDMALVVDEGVTHKQVMELFKGFSLLKRTELFDVYKGKQVPSGKKSLAYRLTFQSPDHTLTDEEANEVQQQILDGLSHELGAALRG